MSPLPSAADRGDRSADGAEATDDLGRRLPLEQAAWSRFVSIVRSVARQWRSFRLTNNDPDFGLEVFNELVTGLGKDATADEVYQRIKTATANPEAFRGASLEKAIYAAVSAVIRGRTSSSSSVPELYELYQTIRAEYREEPDSPDYETLRQEAKGVVHKALHKVLRKLSPEDRKLFGLHKFKNWTLAKLSRKYGKSKSTLCVRLQRLEAELKAELKAELSRLLTEHQGPRRTFPRG